MAVETREGGVRDATRGGAVVVAMRGEVVGEGVVVATKRGVVVVADEAGEGGGVVVGRGRGGNLSEEGAFVKSVVARGRGSGPPALRGPPARYWIQGDLKDAIVAGSGLSSKH